MRPDELERRLRERLDALGPAPRAELLHVLMLPDFERAEAIGSLLGQRALNRDVERPEPVSPDVRQSSAVGWNRGVSR
jgi:hypothetical protein